MNDSEIDIKEQTIEGEGGGDDQEDRIENMAGEEVKETLKKKTKELNKLTLKTAKLLRENDEIKKVTVFK